MRTIIAGIDVGRRSILSEEAKNVALDIRTKLGELALQHQASAQHPKPNAVVESSSDPPSPLSGDDIQES